MGISGFKQDDEFWMQKHWFEHRELCRKKQKITKAELGFLGTERENE